MKVHLQNENANLGEFVVDEMNEFEFLVFCLIVSSGNFKMQRLLLALEKVLQPHFHVA